MKKIGAYILYVVGLLVLVFVGVKYLEEMRLIASREFYPFPAMIGSSVFSIIIGAYIALPKLISTLKGSGRIQADWLKFLLVVVPTFLISITGVLIYSVGPSALSPMVQWVYFKFSTGTLYIGIACGYALLSCINKKEDSESIPTRAVKAAKIMSLTLLGVSVLYFSLSGLLRPMKLMEVHADIVVNDHQSGYTLEDGKDQVYFVQTEITYQFDFKNLPQRKIRGYAAEGFKVWVEPKGALGSLVSNDVFQQQGLRGSGWNGNVTEINLAYTLGSIDPGGTHMDIEPPSPETLEKIKNALYEAELVIQFSEGDIKRYDLSEYKKN